jgi:hypothetical protein
MMNAAWLRGFLFGLIISSLGMASVTFGDSLFRPDDGEYLWGNNRGDYYDSKGRYYYGSPKSDIERQYGPGNDKRLKPC